MELNRLQKAIQQRKDDAQSLTNLSFADFTFHDSLLTRRKIQNAFVNIFKYPYYYPTARGEQETLEAVCAYYRRLGQDVDPGSLILTSTLNQSYLYLFKIFSNGNGEILAPTPHSPSLDEVSGFLGLELKTYPLLAEQGWQIDLQQLEKNITENTRAIQLMSPHLPTGAVQTAETLEGLLKLIKGKNIALIVDESLSDFYFGEGKLPLITELAKSKQLIITLQSLSNSFALPGLKISWLQVSGPAEQAANLLQSIEFLADTFLTLSQFSQTVLPEVVRFSNKWRRKFQKIVEKNRHILVGKLSKCPRLHFHFPEGGFYAFIKVLADPESPGAVLSDEDFAVDLLEKTGIYVHPGYYYAQKDGCYFMICFLQDPGVLRTSLKKIVKYFRPPRKK